MDSLHADILYEIACRLPKFGDCFAFAQVCRRLALVVRERRHDIVAANSRVSKRGEVAAYYTFGVRCRMRNGVLLPAIVAADGTRMWYDNCGRRHRGGDRPAVVTASGLRRWYLHGQPHRESGPAVTDGKSHTEYWLYGVRSCNSRIGR